MAKWRAVEIILEARSPIHIGERRMGVVNLTRRYIPGKNFWGAFTAIIAREMMDNYNPEFYLTVGKEVKENMRFSYFYPYDLKEKKVFIPIYLRDGLEYLVFSDVDKTGYLISEYEFDGKYVESYASAALDYSSGTAQDHYLHELEYLKPGLGFKGYIFYKDKMKIIDTKTIDIDAKIDEWINKLENVGVGGGSTRGFGRMMVIDTKSVEGKIDIFGDLTKINLKIGQTVLRKWQVNLKDDLPIDLVNNETNTVNNETNKNKAAKKLDIALMPLVIKSSDNNKKNIELTALRNFNGDIEPVVGRNWSKTSGAGQKFSKADITISPGSTFESEIEEKLILDSFGLIYLQS
ncbi:hypothetical protein BBF96_00595 [Anoxybacter fermentans]|uniref:CRISPR type III-associated protein domain-containing protein n=1 Tax=Anoxybacter fermentans TaxID=1323375 RepID=A0A3Q9HNM8_9FIRM|nr:RAMP superfamily CRISPR-associated protein [Anoxybacter fermentans]AZR72034.1 hypothetical protein BBF96_00595 [Anoxybacter fermentans]